MYYSTDVRVFGDCTCTSNFRSHQAARSCNAAEEARQHFSESSKTARTERRFEQNSYSRATCELIAISDMCSAPNTRITRCRYQIQRIESPDTPRPAVGFPSSNGSCKLARDPIGGHQQPRIGWRSAINSRRHSSHQPH
ncbi:hypothetical protein PVAP13_7NG382800 [Panicum virgatum]|uniref:Uncharacterized protein n=1 Tax=Panicum virgatum TaxID=38727 RepID=A0A8T0Q814_PANVG|nr:hypothetical protein PVAP13_7NG382800 [Panicum virgatum]